MLYSQQSCLKRCDPESWQCLSNIHAAALHFPAKWKRDIISLCLVLHESVNRFQLCVFCPDLQLLKEFQECLTWFLIFYSGSTKPFLQPTTIIHKKPWFKRTSEVLFTLQICALCCAVGVSSAGLQICLLGLFSGSLSHLDFSSLSHSSWQILLGSIRLEVKCQWTVVFRSLHGCFMDFKSQGQSETSPKAGFVLAVCFRSLSSWKMNRHPSLRSHVLWSSFSLRTSLYSASFIPLWILTSLPVSHSMMQNLWPHALRVV